MRKLEFKSTPPFVVNQKKGELYTFFNGFFTTKFMVCNFYC